MTTHVLFRKISMQSQIDGYPGSGSREAFA